ncbi:nucleotidyltransferase domain-containing protein [Meiothermus hypogaeus]|uniref:Nucleotidyltransferase n=2 Tax=Meiothermus hypogaeus TaxID=884155 RepID=A0A511R0X5_9DEIN|nr:hypothetical protein [Meiothermus hypogaeus]RIH79567.1 hypothetical protein Mhypo_01038 [Meiothermus hypogaeus]GEM82937.1 hypothetical protein MHY01S_11030 [Meiothermus hypogaeus NBRC 106114]GIW36503.1 MAG: hypothetical protein KatS3mg073_0648 [Meiothermus sp.]
MTPILLPERIVQVLRVICPILNDARVEWAVSGSLALALHGLPVVPKDIDLQTDRVGAEQMARLLAEYLVYPPGMHLGVRLVRSYMAQFKIQGLVVEAMGYMEFQTLNGRWKPAPDFRHKRTTVDYLGLSIPVVSLEFLLAFYTQLQRPGRVALIEAKLKTTAGEG